MQEKYIVLGRIYLLDALSRRMGTCVIAEETKMRVCSGRERMAVLRGGYRSGCG
jgi:hypothetical protein